MRLLSLEPGVRITGALVTVSLSDGTNRTLDIPAEYHPDDVDVSVTHVSHGDRHEVHVRVAAGYTTNPVGPPRSYYRTG
jgi:hypothetical protein